MSSRSLAAARARRSGENAPPVSGNRPVTSIGSHAAFSQQMAPPGYQNNMNGPNNVRVAPRGPPQQQMQQQQMQQQQMQQQQMQQQQMQQMPSKLSIGDAIGLITIRLGRIEKWITENDSDENDFDMANLPDNSKIIDNSVLASIINRLDALENTGSNAQCVNSEDYTNLNLEVNNIKDVQTKITAEGTKHSLYIAKHSEQILKLERELVETKDLLKTFMMKYDLFASETTSKFVDFEYAMSELEKNIQSPEPTLLNSTIIEPADVTPNEASDITDTNIMSVDLKNIIKQEFTSISNIE